MVTFRTQFKKFRHFWSKKSQKSTWHWLKITGRARPPGRAASRFRPRLAESHKFGRGCGRGFLNLKNSAAAGRATFQHYLFYSKSIFASALELILYGLIFKKFAFGDPKTLPIEASVFIKSFRTGPKINSELSNFEKIRLRRSPAACHWSLCFHKIIFSSALKLILGDLIFKNFAYGDPQKLAIGASFS